MKKLSFLWFDFVLVNKILTHLWGLFPYKKLKTGIKQPDFSSGLFNAYFYIKVKIYFWVNSSYTFFLKYHELYAIYLTKQNDLLLFATPIIYDVGVFYFASD